LCREAGNFTSSRIRQVRALISGTSYARISYPLGKCPFYVTPSTTLSRNIANLEEHDKVDEIHLENSDYWITVCIQTLFRGGLANNLSVNCLNLSEEAL
jgi:hypothetical protein